MTWPTKTDFVDGDVLTAAQVNNIGTNLNLFDPTSATAGQVPVADGAGSIAYGAVTGKIIQVVYGTFTSTFSTSSTSLVDTGLEVTITPTSSSNYILLMAQSKFAIQNVTAANTDVRTGDANLYDSTAASNLYSTQLGRRLVAASTVGALHYVPLSMFWIGTPPNTSARTYKMRVNVDNASSQIDINQTANNPALMIAWEIAP